MWKRLVLLWVGTGALVYFLFFYRLETHAVKLTMPEGGGVDPRHVEISANWFTYGAMAVLGFVILGIAIWLNFRIVRRYGRRA